MKKFVLKANALIVVLTLSILFVSGQDLTTVYETQITAAAGWETNAATGTTSSVNYSQNGCVIGGGGSTYINTDQARCTNYTGEIGMGGNGRWMDIPLIAFKNDNGGASAGTLSVTWFNIGGGRNFRYYIVDTLGLTIAASGTALATSLTGTNSTCTTHEFILPPVTGSKVLKIAPNGNASILAVAVKTYVDSVTGIVDVDLMQGIKIYPVPANDNLHIESYGKDLSAAKIKIVNSLGAVVLESEYKNVLSVANLEAGVYTMTMTLQGKASVKKLMIE